MEWEQRKKHPPRHSLGLRGHDIDRHHHDLCPYQRLLHPSRCNTKPYYDLYYFNHSSAIHVSI